MALGADRTVTPTDTVNSTTKLKLRGIMFADKSGKGGTNTLKCRLKNNDDWVTITGLKPGVMYPFAVDYVHTDTNVQHIKGLRQTD